MLKIYAMAAGALLVAGTSCLAAGKLDAVIGEWATEGYGSRVVIAECDDPSKGEVCGTVTWLWDPVDPDGNPKVDSKNPDPERRARPIVGIEILSGFDRDDDKWGGGRIYNPEDGNSYRSKMRPIADDVLEVKGCVLFVCQKQIWRRVESVRPLKPPSLESKANKNRVAAGAPGM